MSDKSVTLLLGFAAVIGLSLTALSAQLIGVEYDEAWIIASHLGRFDADFLPQVDRVLTSGGLHLFMVGLFGKDGASAIELARVISLLSFCALVFSVERITRGWIPDLSARLIVVVMMLGTPGTLFLAGMGYAIVPATALLILGMAILVRYSGPSLSRVTLVGLLFGLALATRWTFLPLIALIIVSGGALPSSMHHRWLQGLAIAGLAIGVLVVFSIWHGGFSPTSLDAENEFSESVAVAASASGASGSLSLKPPARLTGFASRYVTLLNVPVFLVALSVVFVLRHQISDPMRRFLITLCAAALVMALAWIWRSPFLHTRYIWPSVLMLNIAGGIGLAFLFIWSKKQIGPMARVLKAICIAVPLGMSVETYTIGVRLIAAGSGYETNNAGYGNQELHFDAFRLKREQSAVAAFVANQTSPSQTIVGYGLPAEWSEMQLSLLSGRAIGRLTANSEVEGVPDIILTHDLGRLTPAGSEWLDRISTEIVSVYGYRIHRIDPHAVIALEPGHLLDSKTYLFTLRRSLSLSGY